MRPQLEFDRSGQPKGLIGVAHLIVNRRLMLLKGLNNPKELALGMPHSSQPTEEKILEKTLIVGLFGRCFIALWCKGRRP
jgi:hypothetical protein